MPSDHDAGEDEATNPDEIGWVALTLEFPDEVGARFEEIAREAGMSLECYCVRALFQLLMEGASVDQKERLLHQLPATLQKNGCGGGMDL